MNPDLAVFSPLGIFFSLIFLLAMSGLLWWMLHPPSPVSPLAARMKYSVTAITKILVPTLEHFYSQRGIELACRLGEAQQAEIILAYVIEVPFSLALGNPLPEEEKKAKKVLEDARTIVENHGLKATLRIERARYVVDKIKELVLTEEIPLVVMGIIPRKAEIEGILDKTAEALLKHLPCEVIVDFLPRQS